MAAYRQVYDSCHLQADYQEPGSAPEPYARQSSTGYLYLFIAGSGAALGSLAVPLLYLIVHLAWSCAANAARLICVHLATGRARVCVKKKIRRQKKRASQTTGSSLRPFVVHELAVTGLLYVHG